MKNLINLFIVNDQEINLTDYLTGPSDFSIFATIGDDSDFFKAFRGLQKQKRNIVVSGPIQSPASLFQLRDLGLLPLLPYFKFRLILVGGTKQALLPQFYVLNKIIEPNDPIIYLELLNDPSGFVETIQDKNFDGISYGIEKNIYTNVLAYRIRIPS